jgi:hypothetical protein
VRSGAITSALVAKLLADAPLMALVPDGVFRSVAGASMAHGGSPTRFVIVSLVIGVNVREFQRVAFQNVLYLVEARMKSGSGGNVLDAAEAIDAVLNPQPPYPPATLLVPGYKTMALYQDEPTEHTEFDDRDPSIYWQRAGGRYRVWAALS